MSHICIHTHNRGCEEVPRTGSADQTRGSNATRLIEILKTQFCSHLTQSIEWRADFREILIFPAEEKKFRELEVRIKREEAKRKAQELGLEEEEVQHAAFISIA